MTHLPRWRCTHCHSELARSLQRGTVRLYPARVAEVYALANGALLLVCQCGRRNLFRGESSKILTAAPAG